LAEEAASPEVGSRTTHLEPAARARAAGLKTFNKNVEKLLYINKHCYAESV
jgi:hypothetical protein